MNDWLIWLTLGGVIIWALIHAARKRRKEQTEADATYEAEGEAELEREGKAALLVRDRSRYARNYAADMNEKRLTKAERERFRQKCEDAKTNALVGLLTIKDDFYRGVATHGVIDLLLAGDDLERAKSLFETLDDSLQDLIVSTEPDEYACLRAA